jgi:phosphate transport system substrate-binding protein
MKKFAILAPVLLAVAAGGCSSKKEQQTPALTGKGSTFVSPLMVHWASGYQKTEEGCKIDYTAVGSGKGIEAILAGQCDFACSDAPLTPEQLAEAAKAGKKMIHIPLVLGAVVPVYNLAEITEPLRFSGDVLADIYLGRIKKWNEKLIKDLNPKLADQLPPTDIVVVHRSDGSGTTYIWADYLSKVGKEWKLDVGVKVDWPVGVARPGNDGVAEHVEKTPGSIGYIELSHALRSDLAFGLVKNQKNEFIKAGSRSIRRAAEQAIHDIPEDLRYSLTNAPGNGSYPICGTTWAIVPESPGADKARQLADFFYWAAVGPGQKESESLFYVPVPESLDQRARKQLQRLKSGS